MKIASPVVLVICVSLCVSSFSMAQDEPLGRLFYTDKERAALDANIARVAKKPVKAVPVPPSVTLNGIVTRSDGERTVWIDGRAYYQGNPDNIRVITHPDEPGVAELKVPGVSKRRPVRVGQQLDPASGKTFESFETRPLPTPSQQIQAVTAEPGAESASTTPTK